jgi:hypothetical protein
MQKFQHSYSANTRQKKQQHQLEPKQTGPAKKQKPAKPKKQN